MSFQALKQARDAKNRSDPILIPKRAVRSLGSDKQAEQETKAVERQTSPPKDEGVKESLPGVLPQVKSAEPVSKGEKREVLTPENENLIVKTSLKRGRSVFWDGKEVCKRGTTLLTLRPEMTVLSSSLLRQRCTCCFRSPESIIPNQSRPSSTPPALQRCSACRIVRYCSSSCQAQDWKDHKNECKALRAYGESARRTREENGKGKPELRQGDLGVEVLDEPGTSVRILARLIWAKQRQDEDWWREVLEMQCPRASLTPEQLQPMGQLSMELAYFLGSGGEAAADDGETNRAERQTNHLKSLGFESATDLLDLVSIFSINSFTAADSDLSPLGISISSIASRFNHSCQPNAVIVWPRGPGGSNSHTTTEPLHVVAIKDISPGEEILTSYVDLSDPPRIRRQTLKERYFFDCDCKGCVKGKKKQLDPREVLWCGKRCGGWVRMPDLTLSTEEDVVLHCASCDHPTPVNPSDLAEEIKAGEEALKSAERLGSQGNDEASWKATCESIHLLSSKMPPSAYPLLALMRCAQTSLISHASTLPIKSTLKKYTTAQLLDEATRLGLVIVAGMQAGGDKMSIFTPGHPARALSIATVGKLLLADTEVGDSSKALPSSPSLPRLLSTPPTLPPPGPVRLEFGRQILSQALEELRIGFGKDGGEAGQSVRFAMTELEREREMIKRAGGRG